MSSNICSIPFKCCKFKYLPTPTNTLQISHKAANQLSVRLYYITLDIYEHDK